VTDFGWEMAFKFNLAHMDQTVARVGAPSALDEPRDVWRHRLDTQKMEIKFEVLSYQKDYGFEYLGNCPRLVITPLTERCQKSLLVAMQYCYGGAPEGPFGTGKTETCKDLGRTLARLCFVLNSSANFEYDGVLRFFKGVASSGSWVVFDEFNRMDFKVLAFLAQVIIQI